MAQLDRNSPLYQQYVTKLTAQETRIEKLREEIAGLNEREAEAQKALRTYVDGLNVT
jgi:selenocysteine-specific translation elongation factor